MGLWKANRSIMKKFLVIWIVAAVLISCNSKNVHQEPVPTSGELIDIGVRLINAYSTLVNLGGEANVSPNNLEAVLKHYENKYSYFKKNDSIPLGQGIRCEAMTADSISFSYWAYHVKDSIQFSITIQAPLFIGKGEPLALMDSIIDKSLDLSLIGMYKDMYEISDLTYYIKGSKSHPMYGKLWGTGCMITALYSKGLEKSYNELRTYCKRYNRMQ